MSFTIGQVCERCGYDSPRAKVCGECEASEKSYALGEKHGRRATIAECVAALEALRGDGRRLTTQADAQLDECIETLEKMR